MGFPFRIESTSERSGNDLVECDERTFIQLQLFLVVFDARDVKHLVWVLEHDVAGRTLIEEKNGLMKHQSPFSPVPPSFLLSTPSSTTCAKKKRKTVFEIVKIEGIFKKN